jgi:hypothetical protein
LRKSAGKNAVFSGSFEFPQLSQFPQAVFHFLEAQGPEVPTRFSAVSHPSTRKEARWTADDAVFPSGGIEILRVETKYEPNTTNSQMLF